MLEWGLVTLDVGTPAYPSPLGSQRSPRQFRGRWWPLRGRTRWALLLLLGVGILVVAMPLLAAYVIEAVVIPRLNQRFGVLIQVDRVQVRPTRVRLTGLSARSAELPQLPPPLRSARCAVEFSPLALFRGRVELTTVTLERANIQLSRGGDEDNISALLNKLRNRATTPEAAPAAGRKWLYGPQTVVMADAELDVRDDLGSVHAAAMDATLRRQGDCEVSLREAAVEPASGTRASADEVTVRWRSPERFVPVGLPEIQIRGGAVAPWKRLAMTGIRGTVKADPADATRAVIELFGGYGGVEKELWQAHGWVHPQTEGPWSRAEAELKLRAESFRLSQLEPILKDTPVIDADKTEVAATLELKFGQGALSFDGAFQMAGLNVFSPRLVAEPVRNLGFDITGRGRLELKTRKLRLDKATVRWNGAEVDLDAEAEAQPRRQVVIDHDSGVHALGWRERWRTVALHIVVPPIDCQAMLAAMPQPIVPRIRDFKLAGTFSTDVRVFVDFAKLLRLPPPKELEDDEGGADTLTPTAAEPPPPPPVAVSKKSGRRSAGGPAPTGKEAKDPKDDPVQVSGQVGIGGCRVLKAPQEMEAARFLESFTHTVLVEPGRELSFVIGPENPDYVPYEELSPYLINSIMTTEDNGFLRHRGFITPEFRSALQSNLERGYFRLGASSITMQMVKNVLLSREKTLSRKLQEMFLTWYLETNLSDDEDLVKALNKGFSVSQYRQQQAKLKKLVPADPIIPAGGPDVTDQTARPLPPPPPTPGLPGAPPAEVPATTVLATAKPFEGAPTGQSNLYAVAQARQALREISPIKKRILEIYFNAIEFGPYIYGIGRATRHYFGKSPKDLNPREASFFSSILPNPKRRYIQYCKGTADEAWEKYVDRIVRRVHSRGRLTDEELQQAMTSRLVFDRAEAMPDRECLALIQHLTELPPPAPLPAIGAGGDKVPLPLPPPTSSDRPFTLPPWITTSSSGRLHYRPSPTKPEPAPEPVPF